MRRASLRPPAALIEDLSVDYRQGGAWTRVLHRVSLELRPGETLGLVGESGCGKSTLGLQLLGYRARNMRREARRLMAAGAELDRLGRAELQRLRGRRLGFVPQNPTTALDPAWRVGRLVEETLAVHGVARGEAARAKTAELFARVGLRAEHLGRFPHRLSGGQQQRVCIALALACEPEIVVLDEPTTGLDVTTQAQIVALLAALKAETGVAMLYITHDLGVLAQIADRIAVMYAGHLVEIGEAGRLLAAPRHPYTMGLIAAAPRIDGGMAGPRLRGDLRRAELPPGCPFAPRCDHARGPCAATPQVLGPAPATSDPGHRVACMRAESLRAEVLRAEVLRAERAAPPPEPAAAAGTALLAVERLDIAYRRRRLWGTAAAAPVVRGATLTVARGEVLALVGESGSGKSTLARSLIGLVPWGAGRVLLDGRLLAPLARDRTPQERRRLQYVFQNPDASLNPAATVGASLAQAAQAVGAPPGAVPAALAAVRLDPAYEGRFPDELSGGERQRAALARALLADPELILCDEILSALDMSVQAAVIALLRGLRAERGLALLFITHDLAVVRDLADRVAVLFAGVVVQTAPTAELFRGPRHPYAEALLAAAPRLSRGPLPAPAAAADPRPAAPGGCPYAARCPRRAVVCDSAPPRRALPRGGDILCHLSLDELAPPGPHGCRAGPQEAPNTRETAT